jgi:tRNA (cmo5U34)-methyltransferase
MEFKEIYMSEFEKSEWSEEKHAKNFLENADAYVIERKRLFEVLKSFYRQFIGNKTHKHIKVLDLGCGSGALTQELLKIDQEIEATLVDGSSVMLNNARKQLKSYHNLIFIHKTFQELLENGLDGDFLSADFDFIVSSLAIHHLHTEEKKSLFHYIYHHLDPGGYFLNIETVKAPTDELKSWYLVLWREWIKENETKMRMGDDKLINKQSFQYLPQQYQNNPDNHPDTLEKQINLLKSAGFKNVDCYYKYGIFSIYGGGK